MNKKVAIVEDDTRLRDQLAQILADAKDIKCVGAYSTAEEGLKHIPILKPDIVLMDIKLPKMSGIQCAAELKKSCPWIQIIIVTIYEDGESIFNALKAGASGYLIKSSSPEHLVDAIHDIAAGGAPLSSHIARKVVEYFHLMGPADPMTKALSPREQEVLTLLASGFIYKEIAKKLNIQMDTVRGYVKTACEKMHVRSRIELVAKHCSQPHRMS